MNNNIKKTRTLILLVILFQLLLLLSIVVHKEMNIRTGTKIIVKVVPVDPRSLFSGDYIALNYEFSQIDLTGVKSGGAFFSKGQQVFVRLSKTDNDWKAVQVSAELISDTGPDEIMIKGSVNSWPSENHINVVYGIESYFVPEDKGKYVEKEIFDKRVKTELSVNSKGDASVLRIFIDEKEVKFR